MAETLNRLDMSLTWWQLRLMQLFLYLGPAIATLAGWAYVTGLILEMLLFFCSEIMFPNEDVAKIIAGLAEISGASKRVDRTSCLLRCVRYDLGVRSKSLPVA